MAGFPVCNALVVTISLATIACRPPADETAAGSSSGGSDTGEPDDDAIECSEAPPAPTAAGCSVLTAGVAGVRLRGTVLGETDVLRRGEVVVRSDGKISCVACDCSDADGIEGVTEIDCGDAVISPALINPHDHITYANNAPIGKGTDRYEHRHDWRKGENGHAALHVDGGATKAEVLGAELRFVMGGATAAASAGGEAGLLRNLDGANTLEGLQGGYADSDTFPLDDADGLQLDQGCNYGSNPATMASIQGHAYLPHIAEGINAAAANEFTCTSSRGPNDLIGPRTGLIHGVALQPEDYAEMQRDQASLVWSPRSNIVLYGNTAPVTAIDSAGVPIALGTDWVASGSMNMLRELQCADHLNRVYFGGHFDDRELWRMATANAARATGTSSSLGTLLVGHLGDITVFAAQGEGSDYRAVIDAGVAEVLLVLRAGDPLYGDDAVVAAVGGEACETLEVCGVAKRACVAQDVGGDTTLAQIRDAIEAHYPLFFCGEPDDEPSCDPYRAGEYAGVTDTDKDGDGVADGDDLCPEVFDPVRAYQGFQGDHDHDGRGDVCDPCPLDPDDGCMG